MSTSKSQLICNICKLVLKKPVTLPCSDVICGEHLHDDSVENDMIKCLKCDKNFDVPRSGFPSNEKMENILTNEQHLIYEEKAIKDAIQELIHKLEKLQNGLKLKQKDMEVTSFDHFTEIRRQIDIQREELKQKIDEIALKLIDQANEREEVYKLKLKQSISVVVDTDIKQFSQLLMREFRDPNLLVEKVKRLKIKHEQTFKEFRAKISECDSLEREINSLEFVPRQEIQEFEFGCLKLKGSLVACTFGKNIQIWNINSSKCLDTLIGHSNRITCLENIDEQRFASGSEDKTIRIWDSQNCVCLKTLIKGPHGVSSQNGVMSLKNLTSNRMASGSDKEIKIWNIESGECLRTLNGHSDWILGFASLPNGNLASFSWDATIKVWDLSRGECVITLTGHSRSVNCLLLLKNGQLASGSGDNTVKIWNTSTGECIKTIEGHSSLVSQLQQLESGELVSCSWDKSIKIWNLTEGNCIRTLKGHASYVSSIRVNSKNNTLVSCSDNGTIKIWDLITGECINIIEVQNNDAELGSFILI